MFAKWLNDGYIKCTLIARKRRRRGNWKSVPDDQLPYGKQTRWSFYPVMSVLSSGTHRATCRESPSILSRSPSPSLLFSREGCLRSRTFTRISFSASLEWPGRWKGPETEGEGEEPVVNQNRRSSESPAVTSSSLCDDQCTYVKIVARDRSPVTVQDQSA